MKPTRDVDAGAVPVAIAARPSWLAEGWRFAKAQLSSGTATFVDWALLTAAVALGVNLYLAIALGTVAGAVTDFAIKRGWVFDARSGHVGTQAWRYLLISALSLAWNELLAWVAVEKLGMPKIPGAITAAILVGAGWNYPMHRLFVFRRGAENPTA